MTRAGYFLQMPKLPQLWWLCTSPAILCYYDICKTCITYNSAIISQNSTILVSLPQLHLSCNLVLLIMAISRCSAFMLIHDINPRTFNPTMQSHLANVQSLLFKIEVMTFSYERTLLHVISSWFLHESSEVKESTLHLILNTHIASFLWNIELFSIISMAPGWYHKHTWPGVHY